MIKKDFQLDRKYLYVNTELGCSMVSTSGESYNIPAGYFVFLVDEVKNFFTTSYVDFVYNDLDTSASFENRDFLISNVQTPFDLNVSSFVQTIGSINSHLGSIDDYCRILQNSLSMILNATLQQNPIANVGSLNLIKSSVKDGEFFAYVPKMSKNFGGTLILSNDVSFDNIRSDYGDYILNEKEFPFIVANMSAGGLYYELGYKFNFIDNYSRSFDLKVIDSDGVNYQNIVFGSPSLKSFAVSGGLLRTSWDQFALGLNNSFDKYRSLMLGNYLKIDSNLSGISITGNGGTYEFGKIMGSDSGKTSGQVTRVTSVRYVIEIPFSVVVSPPVTAEKK